jgi:hypothetical protein
MSFPSTLPAESADLMRASEFQRYLALEAARERQGLPSRISQLTPSLMLDLSRFEQRPRAADEGLEVLEVMAAAVRHGRRLLLHLQHERLLIPLTVFPAEHLVHCPLAMPRFMALRLPALRVLQVEPALLRPPGEVESGLAAPPDRVAPLAPLLWELALRGSRETLLPEIAGPAAYRIAPGVDLSGLPMPARLADAVARLRRHTTNLREIATWPGLDGAGAQRLLNALYLQAALVVSRSHPAATSEGWSSAAPGGRVVS